MSLSYDAYCMMPIVYIDIKYNMMKTSKHLTIYISNP